MTPLINEATGLRRRVRRFESCRGHLPELQLSLRVTSCHITLVSLGISSSSHDPLHGPCSSNRCPLTARVTAARCRSIASLDDMATLPGVTLDEGRLADVCARYGIARLRVFGSVARGTATPDSDIDVLYELAPGRRLGWEIEQLADELAAVFGRPVDLVSPAALHRRLKDAVLSEARTLYAA